MEIVFDCIDFPMLINEDLRGGVGNGPEAARHGETVCLDGRNALN